MDVWEEEAEPDQLGQVRREHTNAGYLAGITASKEEALQPGFDEGYPEGAQIGLEVGFIIGELQGQVLTDLEAAATKELSAQTLFSSEYYHENATPKFDDVHPLVAKWARLVADLAKQDTSVPLKRKDHPTE